MKMSPIRFVVVFTAVIACAVSAFPDFERCNLNTWFGGGPFNQFGIVNYTSGGTVDCVITGVPTTFVPCQTATITLTSRLVVGHKLAVSAGSLGNTEISTTKQKANCRHSSETKLTVTQYRWTAPPDNTAKVNFGGLCGDMRTNVVLFAATQIVSSLSSGVTAFPGTCPLDANAADEVVDTNAATLIQNNIPLMIGIAGIVVAGLGIAGFFAYRRRGGKADQVAEKLEDVGASVKQRIQSIRPPKSMTALAAPAASNGFSRMQEPDMNSGTRGFQQQQQQPRNQYEAQQQNAGMRGNQVYQGNQGYPASNAGYPGNQGYQNAAQGYPGAGQGYQKQGAGYQNTPQGYQMAGPGYQNAAQGYQNANQGYSNRERPKQMAMQVSQPDPSYGYPMPGQQYTRSGQAAFTAANPAFQQQQQQQQSQQRYY